MVLRVQVKFAHSLLKCGWLWVGHNLCLLWDYLCLLYPSRLPVFAVEPQYLLQDFLFLSKVSFEGHIQNLQKISCWFKIWMEFVGPKLIKLWTSSISGFLRLPLWWTLGNCLCKHAGHHSVTTGACSPPHLTCLGLCSMAAWKLNGPICAMFPRQISVPLRWGPNNIPSLRAVADEMWLNNLRYLEHMSL